MNEKIEKELNGKQDAEAMIHIIRMVLENQEQKGTVTKDGR